VFARVSIYEIPDDRAGEAVESFSDALTQIAGQAGLCDAYFLVGRESDRAMVVTLWESQDAMATSRVAATRLRTEASRAADGTIVSVEEFEVAMHAAGAGVAPRRA
jgi:heme-degrading monooxygenase HmoA